MDIISLNEAATANGRIEKFIENPDSNSGVLTQPKVIASGETITIPAGRIAVLPNVQVDGTLNIEGEVFIPAGAGFGDLDQRINTKLDKDFSSLPDKPTPEDTDNLAIQEVGGDLKKVSYKNLLGNISMTGTATLNGTTSNTIAMTGIVPALKLEVGDVIHIEYSGYNKLHTVESITNDNSIIVNYEHAGNRGNGSLKLPDITEDVTVTRIAKWYNAPLGLGQEWVVLTSSRSVNVTYINNTGRLMGVKAIWGSSTASIDVSSYINSIGTRTIIYNQVAGGFIPISEIVPNGNTYRISPVTAGNIHTWCELR